MRVHVAKKQLADSLGHVERIIPARSSNPGLSYLRLTLSDDSLVFSGSNMDVDIEARLTADVEGEGQFAVPAHVFAQVVKALPGELVELVFKETEIEISSGSYDTKLQLVDVGQAPLPAFPESYAGELPAADLVRALSSVRYAAALAEYQAIFRGVKLELRDQHTRAVATDGFRLAYYHLDRTSGLDGEMVLPARSVDELVRILADGPASLALAEGQLSVANGPFKLNVKLMEGAFPDYQRVIPSNFPVVITAPASALAEAVARVAVMADRTANNRVDLFISDGVLQITAEGAYGRSQEALEIAQEGSEGQIALAYNAKYLTDALAPLTGGDLRFLFSGSTTPSLMADPDDPSYQAMVVPLRTT